MGLRDYISSTTETISGGLSRSRDILGGAAAPYLSGAWQNTRNLAKVASESAIWTKHAVVERMPDQQGWEHIRRLGWRIADHAIDHGTKTYTCGIPVYKFVKEELRKDKPQQDKPVKDKNENVEFAALKARIESLEKENMDLQQLRLKVEHLEIKLMETKQQSEQKKKKAEKGHELVECNSPVLMHLI